MPANTVNPISRVAEFNQITVMRSLVTDSNKKLKTPFILWHAIRYLLNDTDNPRCLHVPSTRQIYLAKKEIFPKKPEAIPHLKPRVEPAASFNSLAAEQIYSSKPATAGACTAFSALWLRMILNNPNATSEERMRLLQKNAGSCAAVLQTVALNYGAFDVRDDSAFTESKTQVSTLPPEAAQQICHAMKERIHYQIVSNRKEEKRQKIQQILGFVGLKMVGKRFISDACNHTNPDAFITSVVESIAVGRGAIYSFSNLPQCGDDTLSTHAAAFFRLDDNTVIFFDCNVREFSPWPINEVGIRLRNVFAEHYADRKVEKQFFRLVTLSDTQGDILAIPGKKLITLLYEEIRTQEPQTGQRQGIAPCIAGQQNESGIKWLKRGHRWVAEGKIALTQTPQPGNIAWIINSQGEWTEIEKNNR